MVGRLLLLSLLSLALTACQAPLTARTPPPAGPRVLAGVLTGETVVSGEAVLAGDLLVPRGSRLILRPGTTVRVEAAESTKIDPEYISSATELLVRGSLRIEGTAAAPVRFLPASAAAEGEVAWAGIALDGATDCRIAGVRIEGAETGILCIGASPEIRDAVLIGCRYGLVLQKSSPDIVDSVVRDGEGGIFCWQESHPRLRGNSISGNAEEGVFVDRSSRPQFDRNAISGNAVGLALYASDLSYDASGIDGNSQDVRFLGGNGVGR